MDMEYSKSKLINEIKLVNFRKFSNTTLKIKSNTVIIYGDNALGKTSILESIYLAGMTKSHKTNNDMDLIKNNAEYSIVNIKANKEYRIVISKVGKKTIINNIERKKMSEYIGNLYVVMFSPEDLSLVKGSPLIRRRFLDMEIGQVNKDYLQTLSKYKKVLKERNEILKIYSNDPCPDILKIITNDLIELAKKIIEYRKLFIEEINEIASNIHYSISKENLKIKYLPSIKEEIYKTFDEQIANDLMYKTTTIGPHRDDIEFFIDGYKSNYCSQGQQRTISLSIKLALIEYIKKYTNQEPIILLDDVLSELDDNRQIKLIETIKNNNQTFITTTNIDNIKKLLNDSQIILLTKNEIKELN